MTKTYLINGKPKFVDDENKPLVTHQYDDRDADDYADFKTPNTSKVNETTFRYLTLLINKKHHLYC